MKAPEPAAGESDAADEFFAKYGKAAPIDLKKLIAFASSSSYDFSQGFRIRFREGPPLESPS
jgi:hypothetical protein